MLTTTVISLLFLSFSSQIFVLADADDKEEGLMLIDFTTLPNLHGWSEMSDMIRHIGKSKAVLVLQKTLRFQRGVLFTMLNPQADGAGFAGFRTESDFNLTDYNHLQLRCRGQGDYLGYKVVLRHRSENTEPFPSYELMFQAPSRKFETVTLPLDQFEAYYRGRKQAAAAPLDKSWLTGFELQMYGGVYLPVKQSGTSSLEIDWLDHEDLYRDSGHMEDAANLPVLYRSRLHCLGVPATPQRLPLAAGLPQQVPGPSPRSGLCPGGPRRRPQDQVNSSGILWRCVEL